MSPQRFSECDVFACFFIHGPRLDQRLREGQAARVGHEDFSNNAAARRGARHHAMLGPAMVEAAQVEPTRLQPAMVQRARAETVSIELD